jgi:hypothetical protein
MGSFSIWHWLIVLAIFALVPLVPILAASPKKTLTRKPYALRTIGVYVAMFVIGFILGVVGGDAGSGISFLLNLILGILIVLWSVHRVQNIGWAKWWCLLLFVPLVGLIFWLVLLFAPGRQADVAEVFA